MWAMIEKLRTFCMKTRRAPKAVPLDAPQLPLGRATALRQAAAPGTAKSEFIESTRILAEIRVPRERRPGTAKNRSINARRLRGKRLRRQHRSGSGRARVLRREARAPVRPS